MATEKIPVGIWLIAGYFAAKSAWVAALVFVGTANPPFASKAVATIAEILPVVRRINANDRVSLGIAFLLVLFGLALTVCVLLRQKWTAGYIVVYHGIALVWYVAASLGLRLVGLESGTTLFASHYMQIDALASLLMVAYLLQPTVQRSFGFD